jgi:acyl-homoserine lactone synthase
MAILITKQNLSRQSDTLEKVYRFRHRFFVHHKKWETLAKVDERKIDEFDTPEAVHIVGLDDSGDISTYTRLLPTTAPHLLSDVYPELLQGNPEPTGPDIWEWTRAAINPFKRANGKGASRIKGEFYAAVVASPADGIWRGAGRPVLLRGNGGNPAANAESVWSDYPGAASRRDRD